MYYANQYIITYLSVAGGIDASQTTGIVIQDTTAIDTAKPGIAALTWADPLDEDSVEWITYTSIDGSNEFQGVTRAAEKGSAKTHANGATVAFPASETHINQFADIFHGTVTSSLADNVLLEQQASAPTTPSSGYDKLFFDNSGILKALGSGGTPVEIGANANPWRTIDIPAEAWSPTTTSPCGDLTQSEAATNDIDYWHLPFDTASDERAFKNFRMPASWDGGAIQFRYLWTASGGGAAETVTMELKGTGYGDDDAIDQAAGTAVEVADTWIADGDVHTSAWSSDVTLANSPSGGDWVHLEIMRDVSEDDLGVDALIIGVQIRFKTNTFSD